MRPLQDPSPGELTTGISGHRRWKQKQSVDSRDAINHRVGAAVRFKSHACQFHTFSGMLLLLQPTVFFQTALDPPL